MLIDENGLLLLAYTFQACLLSLKNKPTTENIISI